MVPGGLLNCGSVQSYDTGAFVLDLLLLPFPRSMSGSKRPSTSASSRLSTGDSVGVTWNAAGNLSDPVRAHHLAMQRQQQRTGASGMSELDEAEEDDESEAEDGLFAYLPPASAAGHPTARDAQRPTTSAGNALGPPSSAFSLASSTSGTRLHRIDEGDDDRPPAPPLEDTPPGSRSTLDFPSQGEAYRMASLSGQHTPTSATGFIHHQPNHRNLSARSDDSKWSGPLSVALPSPARSRPGTDVSDYDGEASELPYTPSEGKRHLSSDAGTSVIMYLESRQGQDGGKCVQPTSSLSDLDTHRFPGKTSTQSRTSTRTARTPKFASRSRISTTRTCPASLSACGPSAWDSASSVARSTYSSNFGSQRRRSYRSYCCESLAHDPRARTPFLEWHATLGHTFSHAPPAHAQAPSYIAC